MAGAAWPNRAHEVLAAREAGDLLRCVVTQNVDPVN
jgi:NAD-dependent SIR2 family protein deacetylase